MNITSCRGPYRGVSSGPMSAWRVSVALDTGTETTRGFATYEDAAAFVVEHGGVPRPPPVEPQPRRKAERKAPPPARVPTPPVSAIAEPTPTDGPAFWIGLLTQTALEVSASPSDPLKRGRVLASLATAARGHQDQAELARKVTAMEAAFQDMTQAEDYGTATSPSGAYSDSGDAPQSDRALS